MKLTKRIIQISTLFVLTTSIAIAQSRQESINQDFLMNKKWKMYEVTDKLLEYVYFQKSYKCYFNEDLLLGESFYYLSNTADTIFDMSKLGKCKKGKYLISKVKDAKNDNFGVLEVLKAEGNELILRNIKQPNSEKYFLKYRVSD